MPTESLDFLVARDDLRRTQWRTTPLADLAPGQARLKIDRFALTSNNITYAAFGEMMGYWDFFPASDGLGRVPVWGFSEVAESRVEGLAVGERIFGYLPMSSDLIVSVENLSAGGFVDASPWRAARAAVYNQYLRVSADPSYAPASEPAQSILRPLFMTSFLIDDFLADNAFFGARSVLISSASSKTSLGLAFVLKRAARAGIEVIGLTSPGNAAFVAQTGYYDRVVLYDDIAALPPVPTVFVDIAGSATARSAVHTRFGDALTYSCAVGGTHWEDRGDGAELPGPTPAMFFAPSQIQKRNVDWGRGGMEQRYAPVWEDFLKSAAGWLEITEHRGRARVEAAYAAVLEGRAAPHQGLMVGVR